MNDLTRQVAEIIDKVRSEGDRALIFFARKFDDVRLNTSSLRVKDAEVRKAARELSPGLKSSILKAADNIKRFHKEDARRICRSWTTDRSGATTGLRYTAIEKAGVYVPGGRFAYPSTVLMTAIPARIAGVKELVMATPPRGITPAVLYAAQVSGIDAVYRVGGPAAIAALAYGTRTVPKVDFIAGPGNAFVSEAKRQVFGAVGIDSLAGPSEVAIIADAKADAEAIVADLLAQAEHDPRAKAYLLSDDRALIRKVKGAVPAAVRAQVEYVCCALKEAVSRVNAIAPEHLEIMAENSSALLKGVTNAGAVFLGYSTPTAAGDYLAGPSHVLPTGGTARFSGGLSVMSFLKKTSIIRYSEKALRRNAAYIGRLADAEGLKEHKRSVEIRTEERRGGK